MFTLFFMQLLKSFDRVRHKGLLPKILSRGVSLDSAAWIADYLCNKSLEVRVGSSISSPQPMNAGVPQGSIGPVLFLVFTNYLPGAANVPTEVFAAGALLHYQADKDDSSTSGALIQAAVSEDIGISWKGKFSHCRQNYLQLKMATPFLHQPSRVNSSKLLTQSVTLV